MSAEHVHDTIKISDGDTDIERLKRVKVQNVQADCHNGTIKKGNAIRGGDDLSAHTSPGNYAHRTLKHITPRSSGYDLDDDQLLSSAMPSIYGQHYDY